MLMKWATDGGGGGGSGELLSSTTWRTNLLGGHGNTFTTCGSHQEQTPPPGRPRPSKGLFGNVRAETVMRTTAAVLLAAERGRKRGVGSFTEYCDAEREQMG